MTLHVNKCAVLRIRRPRVQGKSPLCRLKKTTVVYMITCWLSSWKTAVYNVRLLIILERECSSMYRKKKRKSSSVLKSLDWVLGCSSRHFYSTMYSSKKRKSSSVLKNLDWVLGCSSRHFYSSMYRKKKKKGPSVLKNLDWVLGCSLRHFYSSM